MKLNKLSVIFDTSHGPEARYIVSLLLYKLIEFVFLIIFGFNLPLCYILFFSIKVLIR